RNVDVDHLAIKAGHLDFAAQGRRSEADRAACRERCTVTLKDRMPLHMEEDVEVARRCAAPTGLTLARDADAGTFVDAGWDLHFQRLFAVDAALAPAIGARLGDHLTCAVAGRASALDHEETLLCPDLTAAAAGAAGAGRRAWFRAG